MLSITSKIIQGLLVLMLAGCFPMGFIRARSKTARGHQNNPSHRHGDLSVDGNGPRLSWDVGLCRANSEGPMAREGRDMELEISPAVALLGQTALEG